MTERALRRLDSTVSTLLWIWVGMGLGFGALTAPWLFQLIPSRDLAGQVAGTVVRNLDWAAWAVFGAAFLLGFGLRWANEISDRHPVGALHLWSAAAIVALLMCFTSSFIVTPGLQHARARIQGPIEALPHNDPNRAAYDQAHSLSRNLFMLRLLLAAGMALSASQLPRTKVEADADQAPA
jgi:hypothetical protein